VDCGFAESEMSNCGFRFPLTTLPTVDVDPVFPFVPVALTFRSSRLSFASGSLLDALAIRLLPVRKPVVTELSILTLLRGGAAVGSACCEFVECVCWVECPDTVLLCPFWLIGLGMSVWSVSGFVFVRDLEVIGRILGGSSVALKFKRVFRIGACEISAPCSFSTGPPASPIMTSSSL
jgi:hypothetical protein